MSDRKTCVKCGRSIDRYARLCPFCNWDQEQPVPAQTSAPTVGPLPEYVPPAETRWRKPVFGAIGGLLGVIVAFMIGIHVHGKKPPENVPGHEPQAPVSAVQNAQRPHANVTLVPDNGAAPSVEEPITSAPATQTAQGVPTELQRADATAVSSDEYAQMAKRAKAEKKRMAALVDPRSITGAAYDAIAQPQRSRSLPQPMMSAASERTSPEPESQPLPRIRVRETSVARLELTVGADGRVEGVNVRQGLGEETATLIAAVQRWHFKPATQNGVPVAAPFTVELSFHADE